MVGGLVFSGYIKIFEIIQTSVILGPGGCQYCLCATDIPTGLTSTTTSAPGIHACVYQMFVWS